MLDYLELDRETVFFLYPSPARIFAHKLSFSLADGCITDSRVCVQRQGQSAWQLQGKYRAERRPRVVGEVFDVRLQIQDKLLRYLEESSIPRKTLLLSL